MVMEQHQKKSNRLLGKYELCDVDKRLGVKYEIS